MTVLAGMFSTNHFIIIIVLAIVIAISIYLIKKFNPSIKKMLVIMSIFGLGMEILKIVARIEPAYNDLGDFLGFYLASKYLPLHLCSIMLFIFWYLCLINKSEKRQNTILAFMFPVCLFGGFFAILIPTSGADFLNLDIYEYFIYHAGMIVFGLYIPISKKVKLGLRQYGTTIALLACLFFASIYLNSIIGPEADPNFMYSSNPPMANLPYLNFEPFGVDSKMGWLFYLIKLFILGVVLISALFTPFILKERKQAKQIKQMQMQF